MLATQIQANNSSPFQLELILSSSSSFLVSDSFKMSLSQESTNNTLKESERSALSTVDVSMDSHEKSGGYSTTEEDASESDEMQQRCISFYESGFCMRGNECELIHHEQTVLVAAKTRKEQMLSNFPEFAPRFASKRLSPLFY